MLRKNTLSLVVSCLLVGWLGASVTKAVENSWDYSVQVSSVVQASPAKITLNWPQDTNGTPSSYTLYRKSPGATAWGSGTTLPGSATSYSDASVTAGTAYEYRIVKASTAGYTGYGYIQTGVNAPLVDNRGKVVLLVDNTMTSPLAAELTRLQQDLAGDGWTVLRHDVSRTDSPANIKAIIKADYNADPANVKSVFIFGHVPVPYSGQLNPDGHHDHIGAWPADVYYGDMDGNWTDSTVNYTQTANSDPADGARMSNRPGDGKFDQTRIPSPVELEVGRVDLANMTGADYRGYDAVFPSETELLRRYLNKDHNFRHRITNTQRRALIADYFGILYNQAPAASGYRSFAPLVGANKIRDLTRETNGAVNVWIQELANNDYLFAYGCASSSYGAVGSLGSSGPTSGAPVAEFLGRDTRSVFTLLFGSWFGDWDHADNVLRAPLLTNYGLVSAWSGRPHWYLHSMGLGETVGHAARLTQNNSGLYETANNSSANMVHIALMGDPTLRIHPVVPVTNITGSLSGSTASLNWSASVDSDIVGYHVYRAPSNTGAFTRLTSSPITALNFSDPAGSSAALYMVRAIKLENTPSGSYYNPSQGMFWSQSGGSTPNPVPASPPVVDPIPPAVSVTSPTASATVYGTSVVVTASAYDNVAVLGVQFKLDGVNLGAEDTSAPYSVTLNTTTLANGTHTLIAVARDVGGNTPDSSAVSFTVNNGGSTPPQSTAANDTVWFDDALPGGAVGSGNNGDGWNWISASPTPFSGTKAHQSNVAAGLHEHMFGWGSAFMSVAPGDKLFAYVYLDPATMPTEIMLSWTSDTSEHRAYWGGDKIAYGTNNTASRFYAGAMPGPGQWIRLEVPASAVGLEGHTVRSMGFSHFDGRATWDKTGTSKGTTTVVTPTPVVEPSPTTTTSTTTTPTSTTPTSTTSTTTTPTTTTSTTTGSDTAWFDDALPAGASGSGTGGDGWNWISAGPTPFSGTKAHQSTASAGLHEHSFGWGATMSVAAGEKLYAYVYLDPATMPTQIMLSWHAGNWEHRAYWGADRIPYGTPGTAGRFYAGALPAAGQWVRLEVPASAVGLEGQTVTMMGFSQFDGRATWDVTGKSNGTTTPPPVVAPPPVEPPPPVVIATTTTSTTTTGIDTAWFDDALPAGASGGGTGGDSWNWISAGPTPFSGTKAHQSTASAGLHEHSFGWGATMSVAAGDKLYAYVYLDPATLPTEIMLSWHAGNWEHRAYWGADRIPYGSPGTAGRFYAGALPAAGQWVRLEVPASAVGLEGQTVTMMGFSQFDGRATWDVTGKSNGTTVVTSPTVVIPPPSTTTTSTTGIDTAWFDDALPAGASGGGTGGDGWNWITSGPTPFSGTKAHQSTASAGLHEHSFGWGATMSVAAGDKLYAYVYLDPATMPTEIMLSWYSGTWEHRAYWGADRIHYGSPGTAGRHYAGPMPVAGQWVRLEVPASAVGLENQTVTMMGFSHFDGRATWDVTGKSTK